VQGYTMKSTLTVDERGNFRLPEKVRLIDVIEISTARRFPIERQLCHLVDCSVGRR
jgi:hypothetical protein